VVCGSNDKAPDDPLSEVSWLWKMASSDDSHALLLKDTCANLRKRLKLIKTLWNMRGGSRQLWFDSRGSKEVTIKRMLAGLSAFAASQIACPPGLQEVVLAEDFSYASCIERFELDDQCANTEEPGEAQCVLLQRRRKSLKLKRVNLGGHRAGTKGRGETQDGSSQQRRLPLKVKRLKLDRHRARTKNSTQVQDVTLHKTSKPLETKDVHPELQRCKEEQDVSTDERRSPLRIKRFKLKRHRAGTKKSQKVRDDIDANKFGEVQNTPSQKRQSPLGRVKLDGHRVGAKKSKKVQDAASQQHGQPPSMNQLKPDGHGMRTRNNSAATQDKASQQKQPLRSNQAQNSDDEVMPSTRKGSPKSKVGVPLETGTSLGCIADDTDAADIDLASVKFGPQPLVRLFHNDSLCPLTLMPKDAKMLKCKPLLPIRAAASLELVTKATSLGHHSAAAPDFLGVVPELLLPADHVVDQSPLWRILLIAGPSGSGKTSLIRSIYRQMKLGTQDSFYPSAAWLPGRAIVEQFPGGLEVAQDYLCGLGLSSVPSWCKPYTALSIGEQYRANAARALAEADGQRAPLFFDEWTSELDRGVARSVCAALRRWLLSREKQGRSCPPLVLATCHDDVEAFLQPDMLVRCEAGFPAKVMHLHSGGGSQSSVPKLCSVFKSVVDPLPPTGTMLGQWRAVMHNGEVAEFGIQRGSPQRVDLKKGLLQTKLTRCDGSLDIKDEDLQTADEWYYACIPDDEFEMRMKLGADGCLNLQSRLSSTLVPEFHVHLEACKQLRCTHLAAIAGVADITEPPDIYAQHLAGRLAAIATLWKLSPFDEHAVTRCPDQRTPTQQCGVRWMLNCFDAYLREREEQLQHLPNDSWSTITVAERVPVLRARSCDWMLEAMRNRKVEEGEGNGEDREEVEMRDTANSAKADLNSCYDWPHVRQRFTAAGWYQPPNEDDLCPGMELTKVTCTAPAFKSNPRHEQREPAAVHLASYVGQGNGSLSPTLQQVEVLLDGSFDGLCVHVVPKLSASTRGIGVIFGPTGSGKTTFAREKFGEPLVVQFDEGLPAAAHFRSLEEAQLSLAAVELDLAKVLCPVTGLSGGERDRLVLAWGLAEWASGRRETLVVDEFTSLLDREMAKRVASGVTAFAKSQEGNQEKRKKQQQLVFLTSHLDILGRGLLEPDWAFDCGRARLLTFKRPESEVKRRWKRSVISTEVSSHSDFLPNPLAIVAASMQLEVRRALPCEWRHFREHHYKDHCLQSSAVCFVGMLDGRAIVFTAIVHQGYTVRNLLKGKNRDVDQVLVQMGFPLQRANWLLLREHRTVVLPDCQGLGVGSLMADTIASISERMGYAFMSVTAHPTYGGYRERSPCWAALPSSRRERPAGQAVTFSHLWLGANVDSTREARKPINTRIDLEQMSCFKSLSGS